MSAFRAHCKKPCNQCPFRRIAMRGWLGAASPQSFIIEISMERPLPCHQTIDYTSRTWLQDWIAQRVGKICGGSLVMSANMGKLPRDRNFPRLPTDKKTVFARPEEFIAYHESAAVRSWEMSP